MRQITVERALQGGLLLLCATSLLAGGTAVVWVFFPEILARVDGHLVHHATETPRDQYRWAMGHLGEGPAAFDVFLARMEGARHGDWNSQLVTQALTRRAALRRPGEGDDAALEDLDAALAVAPRDLRALTLRLEILAEQPGARGEEGVAGMQALLETLPEAPVVAVAAARVLARRDRFEEAATALLACAEATGNTEWKVQWRERVHSIVDSIGGAGRVRLVFHKVLTAEEKIELRPPAHSTGCLVQPVLVLEGAGQRIELRLRDLTVSGRNVRLFPDRIVLYGEHQPSIRVELPPLPQGVLVRWQFEAALEPGVARPLGAALFGVEPQRLIDGLVAADRLDLVTGLQRLRLLAAQAMGFRVRWTDRATFEGAPVRYLWPAGAPNGLLLPFRAQSALGPGARRLRVDLAPARGVRYRFAKIELGTPDGVRRLSLEDLELRDLESAGGEVMVTGPAPRLVYLLDEGAADPTSILIEGVLR